MSREITAEALAFIKQCEGCRLVAYQDSADVWTIGYGHTGDVRPGQTITLAQADALLKADLADFCDAVDDATDDVPTTDAQFSAMVSLAYNIGVGHFDSSTVLREHRAGHYDTAGAAFLMWDKAGGQVLLGLQRRRRAERAMYLGDVGKSVDRQTVDQAPAPDSGGWLDFVKRIFGG